MNSLPTARIRAGTAGLVLLLALAQLSTGCDKRDNGPHADLIIVAWGRGLPTAGDAHSAAQKRMMAMRAAEVDAMRNLGRVCGFTTHSDGSDADTEAGAFVITNAEKEEPLERGGAWHVRAQMPAPSCAAYAQYLSAWTDLLRAEKTGDAADPVLVHALRGPEPRVEVAETSASIADIQRRLQKIKGNEVRHKDDLLKIAAELPVPMQPPHASP